LFDFAGFADLGRRRRFLGVTGFSASFLSLGYIAYYLRGGPRDPLAPVYWLQGRALAHGELSWTVADPLASSRAGHLLSTLPDHVSGIFPPGYPLLLSAGFLVGAPMLIGPLLSAALALATWALTRELAEAADFPSPRVETLARAAVGLSIASATLRHFTADALPNAAAAVAVTLAISAALRARRLKDRRFFVLAGLAVGAVCAIQPVAALAIGAIVLALALHARDRRAVVWTLLAALPFVLLLLAANRAAVGRALASPLARYFAIFGAPAPGPHGRAASLLLQLRAHLADIDNLEPLALLSVVPLVGREAARSARLVGLVVLGQLVVAGLTGAGETGAQRSLVCIIPLEHALLAVALARVFPGQLALTRAAVGALALSVLGFSVHTARDHQRVASEDLGRPHYEPDVARDANVTNGLLYFDDDQGFELAYDPQVPASHGVQAVRMRGDDHDRLLYDLLGHPQIHRYTATGTAATVVAWTPPNAGSDTWRFEAESDWPVAGVSSARVDVTEGPPLCASDSHALTVTPWASGPAGEGSGMLSLPTPRGATPPDKRNWSVAPRAVQRGGPGVATLDVVVTPGGPSLAHWTWQDAGKSQGCIDLPAQTIELGGERTRVWLVLHAAGGAVTLDKTTLRGR